MRTQVAKSSVMCPPRSCADPQTPPLGSELGQVASTRRRPRRGRSRANGAGGLESPSVERFVPCYPVVLGPVSCGVDSAPCSPPSSSSPILPPPILLPLPSAPPGQRFVAPAAHRELRRRPQWPRSHASPPLPHPGRQRDRQGCKGKDARAPKVPLGKDARLQK